MRICLRICGGSGLPLFERHEEYDIVAAPDGFAFREMILCERGDSVPEDSLLPMVCVTDQVHDPDETSEHYSAARYILANGVMYEPGPNGWQHQLPPVESVKKSRSAAEEAAEFMRDMLEF